MVLVDMVKASAGRATSKAGRVYLYVFNWPSDGNLHVPSWGKSVKKAYLLAAPKNRLKVTQNTDGISVQVPTQALDPIATVVVLETK